MKISGVQPSGNIHLGNYFGAIKQHIDSAKGNNPQCYFIADYHALTTCHDGQALKNNITNLAAAYYALGMPEDGNLFRQSSVPEVQELNWILSTVTNVKLLERAVSYKEKVAQGIAANTGLLTYPVLMAADILLYDGTIVPVGKDQLQHIEICNDIAKSFNNKYGVTLLNDDVKAELSDTPTLLGLDGRKMSKSYNNSIGIFEDSNVIWTKIKKIKTSSNGSNFLGSPLHQMCQLLLTQDEVKTLEEQCAVDLRYAPIKEKVYLEFLAYFADAREKYADFVARPGYINGLLAVAGKEMREKASQKIDAVRKTVGL